MHGYSRRRGSGGAGYASPRKACTSQLVCGAERMATLSLRSVTSKVFDSLVDLSYSIAKLQTNTKATHRSTIIALLSCPACARPNAEICIWICSLSRSLSLSVSAHTADGAAPAARRRQSSPIRRKPFAPGLPNSVRNHLTPVILYCDARLRAACDVRSRILDHSEIIAASTRRGIVTRPGGLHGAFQDAQACQLCQPTHR